jgi:uncharacterized sulfatase
MGFAAVIMALWGGGAVRAAEPARPPNILFILVDDMGYGDLSCFGGTRVRTARIDNLAAEGLRFTQFYVNAPICSPSRTAFTTGQYPGRWKITSYLDTREIDRRRGVADWLLPEAPSLARFLANAGYHTAHVGKWHMGGQRDVGDAPLITEYGFAATLTSFEGLGERVLPRFDPLPDGRPMHHVPTEMNARLGKGPIHWADRHRVTGIFVDRAIEEMRAANGRGQPFYLNLWLDDVHSPCQAPPALRGDGSREAQYLGVMKEMDTQLGRVFDFVRADPKLRDNTLILLASDNGPEAGCGVSGGLRAGKGALYEGGIRSPLIVWYGGLAPAAAGTRNERTVLAAMDLVPSMLALAGAAAPRGTEFDGINMADVLVGRQAPKRGQPVMWVRPPDRPGPGGQWPDLAIRDGDLKLLVNRDGSRPELFDIAADAQESRNLATEQPERVRQLTDRVIAWAKSVEAVARGPAATGQPRSKPRPG